MPWFRLGNSDARLDRPQVAADAYRAALQRNPHLAPAWHNLGSVLLKQAQAAYAEAAGNAEPADPLQSKSALRAARIRALRAGVSKPSPAAHSKEEGDSPATGDKVATTQGTRSVEARHSRAGTPSSTPLGDGDPASSHATPAHAPSSQGDGP